MRPGVQVPKYGKALDGGSHLWNYTEMRVISRKRLKDFWEIHARAEAPLRAWYADITTLDIGGPFDIKALYASASFLKDNRVVFNIGGNKYRLIVKINKSYTVAFVRFVGTHAEYDKIDAAVI